MNILDEFETKLTLYFLKSVKELLFFYELSKDQIYIFNLKTKSLDKACGKKNIYPLIGENSSGYVFYKQSKASDRYGYSTVSCNKINISTKEEERVLEVDFKKYDFDGEVDILSKQRFDIHYLTDDYLLYSTNNVENTLDETDLIKYDQGFYVENFILDIKKNRRRKIHGVKDIQKTKVFYRDNKAYMLLQESFLSLNEKKALYQDHAEGLLRGVNESIKTIDLEEFLKDATNAFLFDEIRTANINESIGFIDVIGNKIYYISSNFELNTKSIESYNMLTKETEKCFSTEGWKYIDAKSIDDRIYLLYEEGKQINIREVLYKSLCAQIPMEIENFTVDIFASDFNIIDDTYIDITIEDKANSIVNKCIYNLHSKEANIYPYERYLILEKENGELYCF